MQCLFSFKADLNVLEEVESELIVDITYLSQLLRRHCRNGTFKNFQYLLQRRILDKKDDNLHKILTSHDKDGYALLHCAAEGGSIDIFKALIGATDKIQVGDTTHDGRTVLHIACKNNHISLCRFLLFDKKYKKCLLNELSHTNWSAAHFTAAGGCIEMLNLLEDNGLVITNETTNGLNILDIACLHGHEGLCKDLMSRDDLNLRIDKTDAHGWTIAHFAAMVGVYYVIDYLIEKNIQPMKTKRHKTILHVCCEYGNYEICKRILNHYKDIIYEKDDEDWNALHYAAKGGNLNVFKEVEKIFKRRTRLCELTRDERTVLHIACINKSIEICQYICNEKSYQRILYSKGEFKDWTAAHYVAIEVKDDGKEEELIRILVKSKIDLKAVSKDKLTVLGVACEHRNRNLINYLLKNHSELLGFGIPYLKNAAKTSNDENIELQINEALDNYKGEKVDI